MPRWVRSLLVVAGVLVLCVLELARPLVPRDLKSHARPAASYEAGLGLVDSLRARDGSDIASNCGTTLYTHGRRVGHAIVLLHGLTNCPAQFDSIGRLLYARGANVLIPRLPQHGYADRMTTALARVNALELCALTDLALDAAGGLGDTVTVAGLSIGGVLAGWAGQERADVHRLVMIAPIFAVARAPGLWTPVVTRVALALPNHFFWWNDKAREHVAGPQHVYPRFATRSIAATLYVGAATRAEALHSAPACREVVMVTVGGDVAADNAMCAEVMRTWRARGAPSLLEYQFPAGLKLNHDVVDPEQVGGNPAITYPVLTRLILP
jgi:pimeloyl-ACP methyl ester carboxylesterase